MFYLPILQILDDSIPGAMIEENVERIPAKMVNYCTLKYSDDIFHDYAVFRDRSVSSSASNASVKLNAGSRFEAADNGDGASSGRDTGGGGGRGRGSGKKGGRGRGRGRGRGSKKETGGHSDEMDDFTDPQDVSPDQNSGATLAKGNNMSDATCTAIDSCDVDSMVQGEVSAEKVGATTSLLNPQQIRSVQFEGGVEAEGAKQIHKSEDEGALGTKIDVTIKREGDEVEGVADSAIFEAKIEGLPNKVTDARSLQVELCAPKTMAVADSFTPSLLHARLDVEGQGQGDIVDCEQDCKRRRVGFVEPSTPSNTDIDAHGVVACREERGREAKAKSSEKSVLALQVQKADELNGGIEELVDVDTEEEEDRMVQCNECFRWVHALCEGIDQSQYEAMTRGTHPVWVRNLSLTLFRQISICPCTLCTVLFIYII